MTVGPVTPFPSPPPPVPTFLLLFEYSPDRWMNRRCCVVMTFPLPPPGTSPTGLWYALCMLAAAWRDGDGMRMRWRWLVACVVGRETPAAPSPPIPISGQ